MKGKCKLCNDTFVGRAGKMFCTIKCKTIYHKDLIEKTNFAAIPTDKILHRNRSILFEIMDAGNFKQKKVERKLLDSKKLLPITDYPSPITHYPLPITHE